MNFSVKNLIQVFMAMNLTACSSKITVKSSGGEKLKCTEAASKQCAATNSTDELLVVLATAQIVDAFSN